MGSAKVAILEIIKNLQFPKTENIRLPANRTIHPEYDLLDEGKKMNTTRKGVASYYDKFSGAPANDVDFYVKRTNRKARVLELGCGTGRVLTAIAGDCKFIFGIDSSQDMLSICRDKLANLNIPKSKADVEVADITDFDLTNRMEKFDLIIAPFRVMQNLETEEQIDGMMKCIKHHLSSNGIAILNTFLPKGDPEALEIFWSSRNGRSPAFEKRDGSDMVKLFEDCTRYTLKPLIVYPELTYERYDSAERLIEKETLKIAMRVWYPDDLKNLVKRHDFTYTTLEGGYDGEGLEKGSEIIITFTHATVVEQ